MDRIDEEIQEPTAKVDELEGLGMGERVGDMDLGLDLDLDLDVGDGRVG